MATRQLLTELTEQFELQSKYRIELESMGGVDAAKCVEAGGVFDVVILAASAINKLIDSGNILPNSRVDLVKSGVAMAVKEGARIFDISNEARVKQAVLAAKTIGYSTGPSGTYLTELFERWGIAEQVKERLVKTPPGVPVGSLVAKGEVELGFQQLSELLHLKGIVILGPLPADIQIMTHFSAGIPVNCNQQEAVKVLLSFLTSPTATEAKIRNGMAPL
ncbi:molybdenum ABC transporter substrate-binding protein [Chania multitudinisentens RB-25]|uniref:Molybdenum ABC transporter substrate-binding protein n=2 Tax=Chania TaxID=1745211 RepID=W0LAW5_9GAMM|nr:molybdenum ABC transporter substrate-binding protein [Chania multitudinisentens RB-25]